MQCELCFTSKASPRLRRGRGCWSPLLRLDLEILRLDGGAESFTKACGDALGEAVRRILRPLQTGGLGLRIMAGDGCVLIGAKLTSDPGK